MTPSPSRPAPPFAPMYLLRHVYQQAWWVLTLVIITIIIDKLLAHQHWQLSKNILAGSVLAWVGQLLFAKIALGVTGYQQRRQIVHRFYLAHLLKWLFNMMGFALIFIYLKPLNALWVFIGFMLLQFVHSVTVYRLKNRQHATKIR